MFEKYDDKLRQSKTATPEQYSAFCDFVYYPSSVTGELLAMRVLKPKEPSHILAGTHGWHMTVPAFKRMDEPETEYLTLEIDMRGRAYSNGKPDCNGYELIDVIDAVEYAKLHYREYISDPDVVYFEAGSGGGGNALSLAGKFPDYFAAINALFPISDYAKWYNGDEVGEFIDEMDVWIGCSPKENPDAYRARSGIALLPNLCAPVFLAHGEADSRVPAYMSREYKAAADALGKSALVDYYEMEGVGVVSHTANITPKQKAELLARQSRNLTQNKKPVDIPNKGRLIIGGYLITKKFKIFLENNDCFAELFYDLSSDYFYVKSGAKHPYTIEYRGKKEQGTTQTKNP